MSFNPNTKYRFHLEEYAETTGLNCPPLHELVPDVSEHSLEVSFVCLALYGYHIGTYYRPHLGALPPTEANVVVPPSAVLKRFLTSGQPLPMPPWSGSYWGAWTAHATWGRNWECVDRTLQPVIELFKSMSQANASYLHSMTLSQQQVCNLLHCLLWMDTVADMCLRTDSEPSEKGQEGGVTPEHLRSLLAAICSGVVKINLPESPPPNPVSKLPLAQRFFKLDQQPSTTPSTATSLLKDDRDPAGPAQSTTERPTPSEDYVEGELSAGYCATASSSPNDDDYTLAHPG